MAGVEERREHPGRHLALLVVGDRAEPIERSLGVAHGVEGLVKVDLERRGLPAERLLGRRGRPGHPGLDVLGAAWARVPARRRSPRSARSGLGSSRRRRRARPGAGGPGRRWHGGRPRCRSGLGVGLGVVVGRVVGHGRARPRPRRSRLRARLAPRPPRPPPCRDGAPPSAAALRELLLELARVQEHEPRELLRGGGRVDRAPEALARRPAGAGRSGRGARG